MKRVFHRLLCWMLVLAIAGLPALAATAGMGDGHAGHAMHGAPSSGGAGHADHAGHDPAAAPGDSDHDRHHARDHQGGHASAPHGVVHEPEVPAKYSQASELLVHADCVDGSCLASCSACSHCQGVPSITGMRLLTPVVQAMSLYAFQSGPPASALYRPPILS